MTVKPSFTTCHVTCFILCVFLFVGCTHGHLQEEWKKYVDSQLLYLRSEILQYVKDHSFILNTLRALNWHLLTLRKDIKQLDAGRRILKVQMEYSLTNVTKHVDSIEEKLKDLEEIIANHQQNTVGPDVDTLEGSETVEKPVQTTTAKPTTAKPTTQKPTTQKPSTQEPTTPEPTTPKPTTAEPTTPKPEGPKLRLAGSSTGNGGRVEVYHNGQWGTVCADNFERFEATVICKMLGFSGGTIRVYKESFGPGSGPIWLSNLGCRGDELSLFDCRSGGWGVHNCGHYEDAGVQCN